MEKKHGGAGRNQGAKPKPEKEKRVKVSLYLSRENYERTMENRTLKIEKALNHCFENGVI